MNAVEFGDLFEFIRNGMNVKQDKSGEGLPISRIETIWNSSIDLERVGYAGLSEDDCEGWLLSPGDILFSHINSVEHIGKCAVYEGMPGKLVHGMNLLCLRCKSDSLLPAYAKHLIRSEGFRARLSNYINKAVNQASVSIGNLKGILVTVPSLPEQSRIAAILDKADALRTKRREALAQIDRLTQSIFVDMFGDPIANNRQWQARPLSEVVDGKYGVKAGPFGSALKKEEYTSSGYRIYGQEQVIAGRFDIGDYYISPKKFEQLQSCAVAAGDLLVSLVGSFGKVLVVPEGIEPGIINPRLLKITPNPKQIESGFLAALLQHPSVQVHFEQVAHGGTMGILNAGLLKQLSVILPSLDLQRTFIARLVSLETMRERYVASAQQHETLFRSVQHRAFSGEL